MADRKLPSAGWSALIVAAILSIAVLILGLTTFKWEPGGAVFAALVAGVVLAVILAILFGMLEEIFKSRR